MRKSKEADRAYKRAWAQRNAARRRAQSAAWRSRNKPAVQAWNRKYQRKKLPAPTRPCPEDCEICGGKDRRALSLDHEHLTFTFRGWLCDRCNKVLGLVHDSPELLYGLADYLENFNARRTVR